jgi:thiamine biosynthesis lipoprotein
MMKDHSATAPVFGRRRFLQIIAVAGAAGALWRFGLKPETRSTHTVRQSRTMMGTQINLIVHGPDRDSCEDAVSSTFARMDELVTMLSRHDPQSALSRLNRRGTLEQPPEDLRAVLLLSDEISRVTDGAFDVTVLPLQMLYTRAKADNSLPRARALDTALQLTNYRKIDIRQDTITLGRQGMGITLDGIGKGYVVDQGVAVLRSQGFADVYVEAGGDLMVSGFRAGREPWRIGIRNPRPQVSDKLLTINLTNRAVATSGDYMQPFTADLRLHHIINPRTGLSPPELASATVTAPTVAVADGLATAAMVMGPEQSLEVFRSLPDCECLLITKDLRQYQTPGFLS